MALQRQLTDEEWDLLAVVTDPILLGEYLRNTADGSLNKEEWTKQEFKYRWYQKDLLSDKSEYISLVAGRAVGKCSPAQARIYTYPYGYISIGELRRIEKTKTAMPSIYTLNETKELVQRRFRITSNGIKPVFRVTTSMGYMFEGTDNHPILTQRGWIMIKDLEPDDYAAVMTHLPHESAKEEFFWEELRWLGYMAGLRRVSAEINFNLKYQAQILEMRRIAEHFDAKFLRNPDGSFRLLRKRGPLKHYVKVFLADINMESTSTYGIHRVPPSVKAESLAQIKIFLEALFSGHGEFTSDTIRLIHHSRTFSRDVQELLLRFGIQSYIKKIEDETWEVLIKDYRDYYEFFKYLEIPGVSVRNLKLPTTPVQFTPFAKFDPITSIEYVSDQATYAITVIETQNYISDGLIVHNSLVLEDKIVYQAVNAETEFPVTKESTLVTANVSQMTPILDRIILRFSASPLLKDFLRGNVNRSKGTLDFPQTGGSVYRINARIAGSRGENNMVGLHVPRIIGDEMKYLRLA